MTSLVTNIRRRFMLSCKDINDFLVAYLEGVVDPDTRRRFDAHVAKCPQCSAYLSQYQTTVDLVREEGEALTDVPEELADLTIAFLRAQLDRNESGREDK